MSLAYADKPYVDEFSPLVADVSDRGPKWYTLRFVFLSEIALLRVLDKIKAPYHHFTFLAREPGSKNLVRRSWFPGYLFLGFDLERDRWHQVLRMPGALGFLGVGGTPEPLPSGAMEELVARLPGRFAKPAALSCVAPGRRIRIKAGPLLGYEAVVETSDRDTVRAAMMLFGRPAINVHIRFDQLEVIG
jgi:transcription antitermination factor NusG